MLEVRTNGSLHSGCCADGICVIVDDFIEHQHKVSFNHKINLAKTVDRLYKKGRVSTAICDPPTFPSGLAMPSTYSTSTGLAQLAGLCFRPTPNGSVIPEGRSRA